MEEYEEKKAARIARLRARADRLEALADGLDRAREKIAAVIPLGQPILVGHHSEKRHRRDLKRLDASMRRSIAARKHAVALRRRADGAEDSRAIASDDPDAAEKLQEKIAKLEKMQALMVAGNKAIRRGASAEELGRILDVSEETAAKLLQPDFAGRPGFAAYQLQNNSKEICRLKLRLKALETHKPGAPEEIGDIRIEESDNRVRMFFPGKPAEEVRKELKSRGFRWSPTAGAWQRHASAQAWYLARQIAKKSSEAAGR